LQTRNFFAARGETATSGEQGLMAKLRPLL
jgi:hypothetical protein